MSRHACSPVDWSPIKDTLRAMLGGRLFLTVPEAAKIIEVDPRTLRRSIEAGECPAVRISDTVRIPVPGFLRWAQIDLETNGEASATPGNDEAPRSDQPERLTIIKSDATSNHDLGPSYASRGT